ncbi:MAG TPA: hypothetical protein VGE82_00795 [Nitrososphaera sp.]
MYVPDGIRTIAKYYSLYIARPVDKDLYNRCYGIALKIDKLDKDYKM